MATASANNWSLVLNGLSEAACTALAAKLAPGFTPDNVVLLAGPIGAGKSHFARAVIKSRLAACGMDEDVPSPTFTLVQTYQAGDLEIWHSDLYRLTLPQEIEELGLFDAFTTALCLIEWPEKLGPDTPRDALKIEFRPSSDPDTRNLAFSASDGKWDWVQMALRKGEIRG